MILFCLYMMALLAIITAVRMLIGPTDWDRLLGFSQFSAQLVLIILLLAMERDQTFLLDVALTYALLGFVGIVFVAHFIRNRRRRKPIT